MQKKSGYIFSRKFDLKKMADANFISALKDEFYLHPLPYRPVMKIFVAENCQENLQKKMCIAGKNCEKIDSVNCT